MRYLTVLTIAAALLVATCDKKQDGNDNPDAAVTPNLCVDMQALYTDAVASVCSEDATCMFCSCDPTTEYMATVVDGTTVRFACEPFDATMLAATEACAATELAAAEDCFTNETGCASEMADVAAAACAASIDASN